MKRISLLLGLFLILLSMGCARTQSAAPVTPVDVPPTAVEVHLEAETPAVTPEVLATILKAEAEKNRTDAPETDDLETDDERILGHCISIADTLPYAVDLDGDGKPETVALATYVPEDEYPRWAIAVQTDEGEKQFETDVPCDTFYDLWVGDLDEDGRYEIFFHGDMASDDYVIYGFRSDMSPLLFEPDERASRWGGDTVASVYDGFIQGFEDGHIVIEGVVDMLGTHWGVRNFAIGDDGVIGPVSTVWTFDEDIEADRPLIVQKELTAYAARVRKDPGESFTLAPGEKLYPLASDGCERLWFRTEGGKNGVLLLTPDEENMWLLDGVPEADCFESLPYAG